MNVQAALKSQYHAALKTLRGAVEKCPEAMWKQPEAGGVPFWRVAYHTLFFAHFYLQQDRGRFKPWAKHRRSVEQFHDAAVVMPTPERPDGSYSRAEILEYLDLCDGMIDAGIDALDLSAAQCGFPWYKMGTLEHQLVNIRHIQHHAAILAGRLRQSCGLEIDWVGQG